jgi:hypothetical protein
MKRFLKNYYFLSAVVLLALVSVIAVRCKKPTEGIQINVNTSSLFHYTALVQIVDPSGAVPTNLSVAITGPDAAAIYGLDGKKALTSASGFISIAVHPKMEPTATTPLNFNLVITGPGYLTLTVPVTITSTQKSQVVKASILNLTIPTAGVGSTTVAATTNAGTVTTPITATTPASSGVESTSITVPTGTKLQDANGNTVTGAVAVTVNNFNTSQQTAVDLFPGGALSSNNIIDNTGTKVTAALIPAGFANIQMTAGGTDIKKFSAPISVSMTLDPAFKNPTTGNTLAAGQIMDIYSYDTGTGQWKYEQPATVTNVGGNLAVNFTTSHLTVYSAVVKVGSVSFNVKTTTNIPIADGQSYPVRLVAQYGAASGIIVFSKTLTITSETLNGGFDLSGLPSPTATTPIIVRILDVTGTTTYGSGSLVAGATTLNLALTLPTTVTTTDLILKLDCNGAGSSASGASGNNVGSYTPPDFALSFKPTGAPFSSYVKLGDVKNGELITTLLQSGVKYDFFAAFGTYSKEVINHDISENTPANQIVGGAFLGTHAGATTFNRVNIQNLCDTYNLKFNL